MKNRFCALLFIILLVSFIPVIMADSDGQNSLNSSQQTAVRKIAFTSKRDGNAEIYTMNENGSGLTRLTDNKTDDFMPQWSPDGAKILYISVNRGKNEIWVMDADGGNPARLAEECDITYPPSWSPDGQTVLFLLKPSLRKNLIYTVGVNGEDLLCVSDDETRSTFPSWSPDGSKILFVQEYQKEAFLYTMNPDGSNRMKITREDGAYGAPAWSPDGKKVAYIFTKKSLLVVEPMICVINADGTGQLTITKGNSDVFWSPDGKVLAFTRIGDRKINYRPGHNPEIIKIFGLFLISSDGNGRDIKVGLTGEEPAFPGWVPDSTKVIYASGTKLNIYNLRNRNTKTVKIDTALSTPAVSPDGKKIIWSGGKAGILKKSYLYMANSDGSAVTRLTNSGSDFDPVWQPVIKP